MAYKWRPSKSQARQFAIRMQNPIEKEAYESRKEARENRRREESQFDYRSAGGNYIPTEFQYDIANKILYSQDTSREEQEAANQIIHGYTCQEKIHHDYIHIVNEFSRRIRI